VVEDATVAADNTLQLKVLADTRDLLAKLKEITGE